MNKQTKIELAFAFSQMFQKDLAKVPESVQREILKDVKIEDFQRFDLDKPFTSQDFSEETLSVLASIFNED